MLYAEIAGSRSGSKEFESDEAGRKRQLIGVTKRRQPPCFMICDASMRILFASSDLEHIVFKDDATLLEASCRESTVSNSTIIHALDDDIVLRIVPLGSHMFGCVAIFVDDFRRSSIFEAAKTFSLTRREFQVLQLLLGGKTTAQIAESLAVAASTAADHTQSIMRKVGVSKRVELIGKIFNLEADLVVMPLNSRISS